MTLLSEITLDEDQLLEIINDYVTRKYGDAVTVDQVVIMDEVREEVLSNFTVAGQVRISEQKC